jgi:tetratricopeptide (TPR) repeat protein
VTLASLASSCAYYNTFYLARRYYFKATSGAPYEVDRQGAAQAPNYAKAIDYCKKVIAQYPKSKWVDDAFLMWGKSLIGRDDPLQTITMLQDFVTRYPKSDQHAEATFYLGLACRNARRFSQSVDAFDDFLKSSPKSPLVPYAHLERARALMAMGRYGEAAEASSEVLRRFPRSDLADKARLQRAEALFQDGDFTNARDDFRAIGARAASDAERFQFLMREADCLESARQYDAELELLRQELAHTAPPVTTTRPVGDAGNMPAGAVQLPSQNMSAVVARNMNYVAAEAYGRLTLRIGTALMLAGKLPESLEQFDRVLHDYPKTALGAESQYRVGYAYETVGDDFERAVQEYGKVKDQFGVTQYAQQADQRAADLGRIMQYRKGAGADSLEKQAEAGFLTAERYLFELKRPDRALTEYASVASRYPGTAVAGRALNAQAWVLSRKMNSKGSADSLFWKVVREYPATEAQIAARDYLEADGQQVPDSLIKLPAPPKPTAADSARALTPVPTSTPALGSAPHAPALSDSLRALQGRMPGGIRGPGVMESDSLGGLPPGLRPGVVPGVPPIDSLGRSRGLFAPGSLPPTQPSLPGIAPTDSVPRGGSR